MVLGGARPRCPGGQLGEEVGLPQELDPETLVLGGEKRDYLTLNICNYVRLG